jgi:hypothetical protein
MLCFPSINLIFISYPGIRSVYYRNQNIRVSAEGSLPSCINNRISYAFSYSWKVYSGTSYLRTVISDSLDPRILSIPTYTLDALKTYTVEVTLVLSSVGTTSIVATASKLISTGRSGVVARFAGGSARTLKSGASFTVDASTSYDIDYPTSLSR